MLHWQGLKTPLAWGILLIFNATFQKRTKSSQKKVNITQFSINIIMIIENDYRHSPFLSSQILLILELSHSHILVKLFCMILMHPQLAFKKMLFLYHNLGISLTINHQKSRNKNNKRYYKIYMVLIPCYVILGIQNRT
jgi:hypothetical protein